MVGKFGLKVNWKKEVLLYFRYLLDNNSKMIITLGISMTLLIKATQTLPIGTAYAVWTGIGAVGTVLVGIFVFKEPTTFLRLLFLTRLIMSIVGLKSVSQ
jgi:quaternary ammonium compound-resistance protein SugE